MNHMVFWMIAQLGIMAPQNGPMAYSGEWEDSGGERQGPMNVTAVHQIGDQWQLRFYGALNDDPFDYDASFTSRDGKEGRTLLQGRVSVAGDLYFLSCWLDDATFYAEYRSDKGANGEFRLARDTQAEN